MLGEDVEIPGMVDYRTSLKTTAKLMMECASDIRIAIQKDTDESDLAIAKAADRLKLVGNTLLLCLKNDPLRLPSRRTGGGKKRR
jgi:hypothetical protein